jgi:hypothetical protein
MPLFVTAEGASRLDRAFDAFRDLPTDTTVPWQDMPLAYRDMCSIKRSLQTRMQEEQRRTLKSVRGVGWRIVAGIEHVELAEGDRRRTVRMSGHALKRVSTADRREMTGEQQQRADDTLIRITALRSAALGSGRRLGLDAVVRYQEHRAPRP